MRKYIFAVGLMAFLLAAPALAQEATTTATDSDTAVEVTTETNADVTVTAEPVTTEVTATADTSADAAVTTDTDLEGVEVAEPTKIPSAFGLWWSNLRENISVALTFDPVKKAEKRLLFAAEREKLAQYIVDNATDEKIKAKATKMMEKAQEQMEKVAELKDKLADKTDERAQKLFKNLVTFTERHQEMLNRMEEKLPEDAREKFDELREKGLDIGGRLMNAINNSNLPEAAKAQLEAVKARIEQKAEIEAQFREDRKALLDQLQSGEVDTTTLQAQLKTLREERGTMMEQNREDFKEQTMQNREELRTEAENGDDAAKKALQVMNKAAELQKKVMEEARENKDELRAGMPVPNRPGTRMAPPEAGEDEDSGQ